MQGGWGGGRGSSTDFLYLILILVYVKKRTKNINLKFWPIMDNIHLFNVVNFTKVSKCVYSDYNVLAHPIYI